MRTIGKAGMRKAAIEIARRLRVIRKVRGLTTTTFGRRLKMCQAQVSRIETGLQGLRSAVIVRACSVLQVSPTVLFIERPLARALLNSPLGKKIPGLKYVV